MTELGSTAEPAAPAEETTTEVATTSFTEIVDDTTEVVTSDSGVEDIIENYVDDDDYDEEGNALVKQRRVKAQAVDLQGYVILVATTKEKKIKLYGKKHLNYLLHNYYLVVLFFYSCF